MTRRMRIMRSLWSGRALALAVAMTVATVGAAESNESAPSVGLTLLCAGAMKSAIAAIVAAREGALPRVDATYDTAGGIRERLANGERPDIVIVPSTAALDLMKEGLIDASTRRGLGETEIGVAVRAGSPMPDLTTAAALKATILAARRIAIVDPDRGTSGRLMVGLFQFLGVDDRIRDRLVRLDGGAVGDAVARGDADIGFQQVSEILPVAGVALAGTLPGTLKKLTRYDVAVLSSSPHPADARTFVESLASLDARATIARSGFTPTR